MVSTAPNTPLWHDPTDVQVRKLMMARLRSHPALSQHHPILQSRDDTGSSPSLLQRLEWKLYHSAGSLSEYLHQPSLERRVQGLVTHYKRKRCETDADDVLAASTRAQRPRLGISISTCSTGARACVLNGNLDLLQHVCSFLEGRDVLRCRAVDKFLYLHAPSLVRSLHIDAAVSTTTTRVGPCTGLSTLLHECKNLTSLTISNAINQMHLKAGVVFPKALTASTSSSSLASTSYGYQLIREATYALERGACPSLKRLELFAPFDFATESDAVLLMLEALTKSSNKQKTRTPLQHLVLDATFLGDRGVKQLAELVESQDAFFQSLETLSLRNNFMGETSCRSLLEAIDSFEQLKRLDLSSNILTDTDALAFADLLDNQTDLKNVDDKGYNPHFSLLGLQTLKLQDNFITSDGFHALTIALCSREGVVATVGNSNNSQVNVEEEVTGQVELIDENETTR